MKVLVAGCRGMTGRLLARALRDAGYDVCGMDRQEPLGVEPDVRVLKVDFRSTALADVFRAETPDVLVHLGLDAPLGLAGAERQRIHLAGTRALLDAVARYSVSTCVFVGQHLYYGAAADLPLYHRETDPPYGVETFPETADLIASDLMAASALWSVPQCRIAVLRFCHVLGTGTAGFLTQLTRGAKVPTVLGFDPLIQFLHPADIALAIHLAIAQGINGIYNVGAARPMPMSQLILGLGRSNVPIPEALYRVSVGRFGLPEIPASAIALLKYPIVVDDAAFRSRTGFMPKYDERATLEQCRIGA